MHSLAFPWLLWFGFGNPLNPPQYSDGMLSMVPANRSELIENGCFLLFGRALIPSDNCLDISMLRPRTHDYPP